MEQYSIFNVIVLSHGVPARDTPVAPLDNPAALADLIRLLLGLLFYILLFSNTKLRSRLKL
jgi:hypothetical protein